jgi:hypothetical protein
MTARRAKYLYFRPILLFFFWREQASTKSNGRFSPRQSGAFFLGLSLFDRRGFDSSTILLVFLSPKGGKASHGFLGLCLRAGRLRFFLGHNIVNVKNVDSSRRRFSKALFRMHRLEIGAGWFVISQDHAFNPNVIVDLDILEVVFNVIELAGDVRILFLSSSSMQRVLSARRTTGGHRQGHTSPRSRRGDRHKSSSRGTAPVGG